MPKIIAQHLKTESIDSVGSIILGMLEVLVCFFGSFLDIGFYGLEKQEPTKLLFGLLAKPVARVFSTPAASMVP